MLPGDVLQYLASRGVEVKRRTASGELICVCPWCPGDTKDTALKIRDDNGYFHCHRCDNKGGFTKLQELLGAFSNAKRFLTTPPQPATPVTTVAKPTPALEATLAAAERKLWEGGLGLEYLKIRGFTDETIKRFRFGFEPHYRFPEGERAEPGIVIPFLVGGKPVLLKRRNLAAPDTKKLISREPIGNMHPLFNVDSLAAATGGMVFMTEGELDAASMEQMGFTPCVSGDNGASHFDDAWAEALVGFDTVSVAYDNDTAGIKGFAKVAAAIGAYRVVRVVLPRGAKDANHALRIGVPSAEIQQAVDRAESPLRSSVLSYDEALRADKDEADKKILSGVGFTHWNAALGGLRPAELSIVCGEPGCGKTTLLADLARRQVMNGHAVLFGSFENRPQDIAPDIEVARIATAESPEAAEQALTLLRRHFTFVRANGKMPVDTLRDVVLYAVHRLGVQVVILDNLHAFLPYDATNERFEIDKAVDAIESLAKKYGIHVFLVVHLRKRIPGGKAERDVNDLLGSIGPGRVAHNIFHLQVTSAEKCRARLTFLKARSKAAKQGAKINLVYNPESRTFTDFEFKEEDDRANGSRFKTAETRRWGGESHD